MKSIRKGLYALIVGALLGLAGGLAGEAYAVDWLALAMGSHTYCGAYLRSHVPPTHQHLSPATFFDRAFETWKRDQRPQAEFEQELLDSLFHFGHGVLGLQVEALEWIVHHGSTQAHQNLARILMARLTGGVQSIFLTVWKPQIRWAETLLDLYFSELISPEFLVELLTEHPEAMDRIMAVPDLGWFTGRLIFSSHETFQKLLFKKLQKMDSPPAGLRHILIEVSVQLRRWPSEMKSYLHDHSLIRSSHRDDWPQVLSSPATRALLASEILENLQVARDLGSRAIAAIACQNFHPPERKSGAYLNDLWRALSDGIQLRVNGGWKNEQRALTLKHGTLYQGHGPVLIISPSGKIFRGTASSDERIATALEHVNGLRQLPTLTLKQFLNPPPRPGKPEPRPRRARDFPFLDLEDPKDPSHQVPLP